jgi:hypothetical protein
VVRRHPARTSPTVAAFSASPFPSRRPVRELLGLVTYRKLMVGEHNIKVGQFSPIRLVFCVVLGPELIVVGSGELRPSGVPTREYNGSGRILLRHSNEDVRDRRRPTQ